MKLVQNWRQVLRAYSTMALSAVVAIPAVWLQVPDSLKAMIPGKYLAGITIVVGLAGLVGRFIDQGHGTGGGNG